MLCPLDLHSALGNISEAVRAIADYKYMRSKHFFKPVIFPK
jgi:hypothetical protein